MITEIFSWGYWGWGNSISQLLEATAMVERSRGFKPPIFVDIRISRSVRAKGFNGNAFEKQLGHARYRWMRSLGNDRVVTGDEGIKIHRPEAADELLDLALGAIHEGRRVIFCSCELPAKCHRREVTQLILKAARNRGVAIRIGEWPGGEPAVEEQLVISAKASVLRGLQNGTQKRVPVHAKISANALGMPWGSIIRVTCGSESVLVSIGPAAYSHGRWSFPVFLFPVGSEDAARSRLTDVLRERKLAKYEAESA